MVANSESSTLFASIFARGLGVLYGILSILNFKSAENLNIWILSGYVATVVTLANIILKPVEQKLEKVRTKQVYILGKSLNSKVIKRVLVAFGIQVILAISVVSSSDLKVSSEYIFSIFLIQSLQYPFLFRILSRNEYNYFRHSRIHLLRASFVGNAVSLLSILAFYFSGTYVDSTFKTFVLFLFFQIFSLAVQDIMYSLETRSAKLNNQERSGLLEPKKQFFINRILPGLRSFIYVPCVASFWLFIHDPLDPEITSVFLGLNLVTLLTYLGLPNDKLDYAADTKGQLVNSLKRILKRSIFLYFLMLSFMLFTLFVSSKISFADQIINVQNITSMAILSFIGLFLLPIVLLSNNQDRDDRSNLDVLDVTVLLLILSFAGLLILTSLSATACVALSYVCSFTVWYTITICSLRKKDSSESSR